MSAFRSDARLRGISRVVRSSWKFWWNFSELSSSYDLWSPFKFASIASTFWNFFFHGLENDEELPQQFINSLIVTCSQEGVSVMKLCVVLKTVVHKKRESLISQKRHDDRLAILILEVWVIVINLVPQRFTIICSNGVVIY
jgi:hypothetical protein